jgi:hypothetical protein
MTLVQGMGLLGRAAPNPTSGNPAPGGMSAILSTIAGGQDGTAATPINPRRRPRSYP